jgi:hypothetical protein
VAVDFDIPAQPLASAIEKYNAVTGRNALYNSTLALGLQSSPLHGRLPPIAALAILLDGTGLTARQDAKGSTVILRSSGNTPTVLPPATDQFYRQVQTGLQAAMCADVDARPGDYAIAFRFWTDASGRVIRYERGSTGQAKTDEGIDRALRQLRIDAKPPTDFVQPIFIAIQPKAPGVTMGCEDIALRPTARP